jgi:transposase
MRAIGIFSPKKNVGSFLLGWFLRRVWAVGALLMRVFCVEDMASWEDQSVVKNKFTLTNIAMPLTVKSLLRSTQDFDAACIEDVRLVPPSKPDAPATVAVDLIPHPRRKPLCSQCLQPAPGYDRLPSRQWQYLPLWHCAVVVNYAPRRVACSGCGIKVEAMKWSAGKSPYSVPLMHSLARWARRISWKEVAGVFKVSWDAVYRSVAWLVAYGLAHRKLDEVSAIGVDELHWGKGKRSANFVTVIYQINAGARRLLWVGQCRTQQTLARGLWELEEMKEGFCQGITVVCSDMWKAFLKVIRERLPQACNVLDPFHIAQHLNRGLDEVRRKEQSRMNQAQKAMVKGTRFQLLKRGTRVRGLARRKLNAALAALKETSVAWVYKEAFRKFWSYRSPTWAGAWLDGWIELVRRTKLKPMVRVADMLATHRELMLNYFRAKREFTSAVVEGKNHKARVMLSKSYGHRSYEVLEMALYHALGELPEPPLTHKFC